MHKYIFTYVCNSYTYINNAEANHVLPRLFFNRLNLKDNTLEITFGATLAQIRKIQSLMGVACSRKRLVVERNPFVASRQQLDLFSH